MYECDIELEREVEASESTLKRMHRYMALADVALQTDDVHMKLQMRRGQLQKQQRELDRKIEQIQRLSPTK